MTFRQRADHRTKCTNTVAILFTMKTEEICFKLMMLIRFESHWKEHHPTNLGLDEAHGSVSSSDSNSTAAPRRTNTHTGRNVTSKTGREQYVVS